ncbi:uncharacterized protein LOC119115232 isoform X1 [Syngnathus acus]|uniref:uncharacterized protein LOC119115232 isoform X1 n=1 Tax=Syngnathus acus TaxID=161584 RepID=UPI001885BFD0|nr:uncharacterized protein LOC119115232 isoform X1 [Syngnathus acus]
MVNQYSLVSLLSLVVALVAPSPDSAQHLEYVLKGQEINFLPSIPGKPDLVGWIHDGIDVVWFDLLEEYVFPPYEDRITLNQESARLIIKDATYEDSGNYDLKLMINGQHHRLKYRIEVIDKVDQPHISCVLTSPNRVLLVCSTDSKHPDLLEFKWSANGKEHPGPNLQINVRGKHDDRVYRCEVSNPLTKETATFTAGDCFLDKPSDGPNDIRKSKTTALLIGVVIILIIITVIVITVVGLRRKGKARFEKLKSCVLRRQSSTSESMFESKFISSRLDYCDYADRSASSFLIGLLRPDINLRQKVKDILKRRLDNIKRPNAVWHLDLCDALKPFGITNHGCIDAVSQRIFWLKADNASNAPEVIANHFLDTVEDNGGCPQWLLADPHPENMCIRKVQGFLHGKQKDYNRGEQNYIDECNTTKEQKESWFLILCEKSFENWTKVFQNLKENGLFTGSDMDKELIKFCFLKPIQDKLNGLLRDWNSQPAPEATKHKLRYVSKKIVNKCKQRFIPEVQKPENEPVYERCRLIMAENGWNESENEEAAAELFGKLRNELLNKIPQQMPQITTEQGNQEKEKKSKTKQTTSPVTVIKV